MALITVAMLADTSECPAGDFVVYVQTLDGVNIPTSPYVTVDEIGVPLKAVVYDLNSTNSCWAFLTVEDKLPPELTCNCPPVEDPADAAPECIVNCLDAITYPGPDIEDNCDPNPTLVLLDEYTDTIGLCNTNFISRLTRVYTAYDQYGNYADTCEQVLFLERIDFNDIWYPPSFQGADAFECTDPFLDLDNDGIPDPAPISQGGAGIPRVNNQFGAPLFPNFIYECNAQITYEDVPVGPTSCTKKVMRIWTAREWHCTEEAEDMYVQWIEVRDLNPPDMECPDDITVSTGSIDCEALVLIPELNVTDACSWVTQVSVSYPGGFTGNIIGTGGVYVSLPVGDNIITYTAYDECFNSTSCQWVVTVEDNTPPVPICDEHTVVSLTTDGLGGLTLVNAAAFDDGSYDECGPVTFEARRMASCIDFDWTTWGAGFDEEPDGDVDTYDRGMVLRPYVPFACCDVNQGPIMIEVRVTDESGNHNTCMVEISVQDKIGPEIECPADITVSCTFDFDINDLSIFGTVRDNEEDREEICVYDPDNPNHDGFGYICIGLDGIATDNCGVTISETSFNNIDNCGTGTITRSFLAVDDGGRSASCAQTITIFNYDPFYITDITCFNSNPNDGVIWPCDVTVTGCGADVEPEQTGFPIIFEDECDLIGFNYEDLVFPFVEGACFKILRTWQIIDWCQFAPSSQSSTGYAGLWEYQQVIKVIDDADPEFTTSQPDIVLVNEVDCEGLNVDLFQTGTDDCTPDAEMVWELGVDFGDDGDFEINLSGNGPTIDQTIHFDLGVHRVVYTFEDNCGNKTVRDQSVEIISAKPPTPVCLFLTAELDPDGEVVIWAVDFDASSFHDCGYPITFSFTPDTTDKSRVFDCSHVGAGPIPVEIWVTDLVLGEQAYCETNIVITDNDGVCGGNQGTTGIISGVIETEFTERVHQVQVDLGGSGLFTVNTSNSGQYTFPGMPFGGSYEVMPFKNDDWRNGVSTLDLIGIQKHLLGMELLDSPYKMIAADANNSGSVSAVDLVLLRKLILGVIAELPENTSWRFVDAGYQFTDPQNPLGEDFPESYTISSFLNDMPNVDFVGIKVGDVNNSVQANATSIETRSPGAVSVKVRDRVVQPGEVIEVVFTADEAASMMGYQFTLNFNTDVLAFEGFSAAGLDVDEDNFGLHLTDKGVITTSWSQATPVTVDRGEALFVLKLRAVSTGVLHNNLSLGSNLTRAEAYNADGDVQEVRLDFENLQDAADFALLQNTPNPFSDHTMIAFTMPVADAATVTVYDLTGKVVFERQMNAVAGMNEVRIEANELRAEGVLYYQVQTGEFSATRKMLRLK